MISTALLLLLDCLVVVGGDLCILLASCSSRLWNGREDLVMVGIAG
jgi:hypothetical protein